LLIRFKKFKAYLENVGYMQPGKTGTYLIISCFLLVALMPATVAAASENIHAPLIALNLLQEKPKTQWTYSDWQKAGNEAKAKGNYQEAIDDFNYAEIVIHNEYPDRHATGLDPDYWLADIEENKASTYDAWPGHQKEAEIARAKMSSFLRASEAKGASETTLCLIATATFGSPIAPQVQLLRDFRENNIYSTKSGTQFMTGFNVWYYSFSPMVANFIDQHPVTKPPMRVILTPLLGILSLSKMSYFALSSYPDIAVIVAGFVASTLIGVVYAFPLVFVLLFVLRMVYPFTLTKGVIKILGGLALTGLALLIIGGLVSVNPVLLVGSVLFIVSMVLLIALVLSWVCLNRLDLRSEHKNSE